MNYPLSEAQKFDLRLEITDHAKTLGFDLVGFSPAKIEEKYLKGFEEWLAAGREGTMEYMRKIAQRRDINLLLPGAKTVIVFGLNYYHEQPPLPRGHGRVARYAYGRDYHKVIEKKLRKMEEFIAKICAKIQPAPISREAPAFTNCPATKSSSSSPGTHPRSARADLLPQKAAEESHLTLEHTTPAISPTITPEHTDPATSSPLTKSYVDTGPILERAYAEQAGLGRMGKNGCVISKEFGSWIFLSEIITTIDMNFSTTHQPSTSSMPLNHTFPRTESATISSYSSPHIRSEKAFPGTLSRWSQTPLGRWSSPSQKSFNICGNCNKCITACPTGAIIAPGVVDSRLCISYLTIENRKKIPPKLAKIIKKTKILYGCDICQEVCPHNRARQCSSRAKARPSERSENLIPSTQASADLDGLLTPIAGDSLDIRKLLKKSPRKSSSVSPTTLIPKAAQRVSPLSSDTSFLRTFAGSPLMRAKRRGLQRTANIISRPPASRRPNF